MTRHVTASLVLVGMVVGLLGLSGCSQPAAPSPTVTVTAVPAESFPTIKAAAAVCGLTHIAADTRGLAVDVWYIADEDDYIPDVLSVDQWACLVNGLGAPRSLGDKIDMTDAGDGLQSDTFPGYDVTWKHYPSGEGFEFIVESRTN